MNHLQPAQPCLGLVFCYCFFVEWGQEIHQQSYTALDNSTDGLGTLLSADVNASWRRSRKIITQSDWAPSSVPEQSEQCSLHAETCQTAKPTLPYWSQLYFIYTERDKTPQFHFRYHPLVFTLRRKDESTTGMLGTSQDSCFCQALSQPEGQNIFQLELIIFRCVPNITEVFQLHVQALLARSKMEKRLCAAAVVEHDSNEGHCCMQIIIRRILQL